MYLMYLRFIHPGVPFYEQDDTDGEETLFPQHRSELPEGWAREPRTEWVMYTPAGTALPWQGWKIHASATMENAEHILGEVASYCFEHGVPFKALSSPRTLSRRNSKYSDRGGSGKFITLYPPAPDRFASILEDLDARVGGLPGPTILSDLRYLRGPLYTRYGAFVSRRIIDAGGRQVECVEDPDGNLVPDERRPGFHPPSWAVTPEVLRESLALRNSRRLDRFPYAVSRALHFSNGGGVYLAERRDTPGTPVLLKEARPLCGLDESGRDARARLERERDALVDLAGLPGIPRVDDYVEGVEHVFLGRAYVEGKPLMELAMERNPLVNPESDLTPRAYADWARTVTTAVTETVTRMHERGWVFGDLHPGNIIVDDADGIHFIDFESASQDVEGYAQTMGVFGFRAPVGHVGRAVDLFALACMRIALLVPLTRLLSLGPGRAEKLCHAARERFGLPDDYFEGIEVQLGLGPAPEPAPAPPLAAPATGGRFAACLSQWRTPDREDRLFPGDIRQFLEPAGGLGLAYGAAGMLWAVRRAGGEVDPADLGWLRDRVAGATLPVGFWRGLAGIAYATQELDPVFSEECLDRAVRLAEDTDDLSLGSGISGLGTYLLTRPDRLADAGRLADRLAKAVSAEEYPEAGLLDGASGLAVFALRAATALDRPELTALATELLAMEVGRFGFGQGDRPKAGALPAFGVGVGSGALGLGLALHEHARADGQRFAQPLRRIVRIARRTTALHNGLLNGRAGQVQFLQVTSAGDREAADAVRRCLTEADWHLTPLGGHLVGVGDESLKLSLDLGTGLAGTMLTHQAVREGTVTLPLWDASR